MPDRTERGILQAVAGRRRRGIHPDLVEEFIDRVLERPAASNAGGDFGEVCGRRISLSKAPTCTTAGGGVKIRNPGYSAALIAKMKHNPGGRNERK